ncbi:MAG: protein-disulfide reductase DsbD domain-containing protein [Hyphomicrobiaceae bacterium]
MVGSVPVNKGGVRIYAGLEVELAEGWKTYWRQPGDAGGIPPYFDWSKSKNLKSTAVKFPPPTRFRDSLGEAIGYKRRVVYPVLLEPEDWRRPLGLALDVHYGVCREICIPAQARFAIEVHFKQLQIMPPSLAEALQRLPKGLDEATSHAPRLAYATSTLTGASPSLVFDVTYPQGLDGADLFIDAGSDVYLPMAKPIEHLSSVSVRYRVDLGNGVDRSVLAGRRLVLTLVGANESVEMFYDVPTLR